jgi:hypothetical protein
MEIQNKIIPIEILVRILSFMPKNDVKEKCRFVSKAFNDAASLLHDAKSVLIIQPKDFVS